MHAMACLNARVGVSKCLWRCEKVLEIVMRNGRFLGKKSCILTHKTMHFNTQNYAFRHTNSSKLHGYMASAIRSLRPMRLKMVISLSSFSMRSVRRTSFNVEPLVVTSSIISMFC